MKGSYRSAVLGLVAAVVLGGCATQSAGGTTARHNLVTTEQLARAGDVSLYDALRTVRPTFLRTRQPAHATMPEVPVKVFMGGLEMMEGLDHLRQIMARNVQEVEFLEPHQAITRFGGGTSGGALVIVMKP